jgi:hypothetical protein
MIKFRSVLFLLFVVVTFAQAQEVSNISLAWAGNSINSVVFRRNSVVSFKNQQYVSYYNADGYVIIAKRKLGSDKWQINQTQYKGNIKDAHNSISIMIDGDGFLHISWDQHASKLRYAKSIKPNSLELGPEITMIGRNEMKATYPEFYKLKNGDLIFLYREGMSGKGNLVLNRYHTKAKKWARVHDNLIDGQGQRNAYWQACIDNKGVFHVSWVWREESDVATNHDLNYAKSLDGGKTWMTSQNEIFTIPMSLEHTKPIWDIPQKSELINSTSITTDEKGFPYIATYWRASNSIIPQYQIVYFDGNKWQIKQVSNRKTPFSLSGSGTKKIPISRPQIVVNDKEIAVIFRDEERENKVSVARINDIEKGNWIISDLINEDVGQWEPSFDTELWKNKKKLNLFVLKTGQGDGEKIEKIVPQMVKIINFKLR